MERHRRLTAAAVGLLVSSCLLGACGESGAADVTPGGSVGGAESSSTSASPGSASASASPTQQATRSIRSALEDQAPVKAARAWAAAVATEVNSRSSSHARTKPLSTRRGARTLPKLYADDYGLRYPGPLPFTPLSVEISGRTARVPVCIQSEGWAVDANNVAPGDTTLLASTFVLKRAGGSWKLDTIKGRQQSCADVTVKGYTS